MKRIAIACLALSIAGCASQERLQRELEVRVGAEAASVGHVPLTEAMIRDHVHGIEQAGLLSRYVDKAHRQLATDTLIKFYWEQGEDHALLDHLERHYDDETVQLWECRIYERRGYESEAAVCWTTLAGTVDDNAKRAIRTGAMVDVFAGENAHYGYQKSDN